MDEENDVPLVDLHVDLNEKIAKLTSGQHERRRWCELAVLGFFKFR